MLSMNRLLFAETLFAAAKVGAEALLAVKLPNIGKGGSSALWAAYNNVVWELSQALREALSKGLSGPFLDRASVCNEGLRALRHLFGGRQAPHKISDPAVAVAAAQSGGISALEALLAQTQAALAAANAGKDAEAGGARKGARYVSKGSKGKVPAVVPAAAPKEMSYGEFERRGRPQKRKAPIIPKAPIIAPPVKV